MARRAILLLLCLGCAVVQAAEEPLQKASALSSDGDNRLWSRLVASLNINVDEAKSHATMFVPTDRAVDAFLADMGLTFDQLLARPVLVDSIISYHLVPGITITNMYGKNKYNGNRDLISTNPENRTVFATADVNDVIEAYKSPLTGLIALVDAQGNRAVVVGGSSAYGSVVFYDISAVLMSSSYFFNAPDAFRLYPQWSGGAELFSKAAMFSDVISEAIIGQVESTFLIPNNAGISGVARALAAAPADGLAQVMEYHIIPGLKPVPAGWQNDATVTTKLPGQTITSKLSQTKQADVYSDQQLDAPVLTLVSGTGKSARVTAYNIYAGKSIIHALDAPLLPNIPAATRLLVKAPKAGGTGRHLLQRHRQRQRFSGGGTATQRAMMAAARGNIPSGYRAGSNWVGGYCVNCRSWVGTV